MQAKGSRERVPGGLMWREETRPKNRQERISCLATHFERWEEAMETQKVVTDVAATTMNALFKIISYRILSGDLD